MFGKRKGRKAREEDPAASYEDTKNNMKSSAEERIMASKKRSEDHDPLLAKLESQDLTRDRKAALADVKAARPDVMERVSAAKAPLAKAPAAAPSMLSRGVFNNNDVRRLQTDLKDIAAALKLPELDPGAVDGDFGKNTETALMKLQESLGLEQTGVADDALRARILEIRQDAVLPGGSAATVEQDRREAERAEAVRPVLQSATERLYDRLSDVNKPADSTRQVFRFN